MACFHCVVNFYLLLKFHCFSMVLFHCGLFPLSCGLMFVWFLFYFAVLCISLSLSVSIVQALMPLKHGKKRATETFLLLNFVNGHHTHRTTLEVLSRIMNKTFPICHGFRKSRKHLLVESKRQWLNNTIIPPPSFLQSLRHGWIDVFAFGYLVPMQCSLEWE